MLFFWNSLSGTLSASLLIALGATRVSIGPPISVRLAGTRSGLRLASIATATIAGGAA